MPAVTESITRPASIARPPAVVTTSACMAAARLARLAASWPMSRYEKTVVASHSTNSTITSSAMTRPYIDPANAVRTPANRPSPGSSSPKYDAQ